MVKQARAGNTQNEEVQENGKASCADINKKGFCVCVVAATQRTSLQVWSSMDFVSITVFAVRSSVSRRAFSLSKTASLLDTFLRAEACEDASSVAFDNASAIPRRQRVKEEKDR